MFDAAPAERYGWVNRAIPDAEMDAFVSRLAQHIAQLPDGVIQTMKQVLPPQNYQKGFKRENDGWLSLVFAPKAATIMSRAMQNGAQTTEGELELENLLRRLV